MSVVAFVTSRAIAQPAPSAVTEARSQDLRVALLTDSREPSGLGAHMLTLAYELLGRGVVVSVAAPPEAAGLLERAGALGCATMAFEPGGGEAPLRAWLSGAGVHVAHVHAGVGWEGHGLAAVARDAGVWAVVRTEHLPHVLTKAEDVARYHEGVRKVDRLICVSEGVRASFVAAGVPGERMSVVRNGIAVSVDPAARDRARRRLGWGEEPLLLTVARMTEQKAHGVLLDAMRAVLDAAPGARLLLVGTGPLEAELRERARRLEVGGAVRFLGRRSDVPELMAAADLLVLPSRFEGLPIVALEAMAAGLPIVGTRVCGTSEAVEEGATGLLVEEGDAAGLAAAIVELLSDRVRRERMGAAGQARLRREFTARRMAGEMLAVYEELVVRPAARAA